MSWSTAPTLPERKYGPSWTTDATPPTLTYGPSWFTHIERVAPFGAEGQLSATVVAVRPAGDAAFGAEGKLSATIKPVKAIAAAFSAEGRVGGTAQPTVAIAAAFSAGSNGIDVAVNDGLFATIGGGTRFIDGLSATVVGGVFDGLSATVVPSVPTSVPVAAAFAGEGTFGVTVRALIDGLYAEVVKL